MESRFGGNKRDSLRESGIPNHSIRCATLVFGMTELSFYSNKAGTAIISAYEKRPLCYKSISAAQRPLDFGDQQPRFHWLAEQGC